MKRIIKYISIAILFILLVGFSLLMILLHTNIGLNYALSWIHKFIPGTLEIGESRGTPQHFVLHNVRFKSDAMEMQANQFEMIWSPLQLLFNNQFITYQVISDNVTINILPAVKSTKANQSWIPNFSLNNFVINNLNILNNGKLISSIKTINIIKDPITNLFNVEINASNAFVKLQGAPSKNWNGNWQINLPNLNLISNKLNGALISSGSLSIINNIPIIEGVLHASHLRLEKLSIPSLDGTISSIRPNNGTSQIELTGRQIQASKYLIPLVHISSTVKFSQDLINLASVISFQDANQFRLTIDIPNNFAQFKMPTSINGNMTFQFNDINRLISLEEIKSPQGIINGNIKISGTLSNPRLLGSVNLRNGQFSIPRLGIQPRAVNLQGTFNQNLLLNFGGNFSSGNGHGTIKGTYDLAKSNQPLNVVLQGNQLQIANLKEYKITANPDLKISIAGPNATVSGSVLLPYINIVTQNYNQVVTLPDELVFSTQKPSPSYFKNLAMRIRLILGNTAHLEYQELNGDFAGEIELFQIPGGLPSGNGTLKITHGTYAIYDKLFNIKDGRFIYVGNLLTNPGLSIEAVQQLNTQAKSFFGIQIPSTSERIKVGLMVRGTLKHPVVTLFSDPKMSQDDILSYMLFGQPRSQISAVNALSLLSSVTADANMQGPSLNDERSPESGFSNIFKMGILNPIQALNFNLPITKHWGIQTETSPTETGADVFYNYETDSGCF